MNRFLSVFNFAGVLLLAVLCVLQWEKNRSVELKLIGVEEVRDAQLSEIDAQGKAIKETMADLEEFRGRLMAAGISIQDAAAKAQADGAQIKVLQRQNETLKASLHEWTNAVESRDEAIKKAAGQLEKVSADRNGAILKFNGLAEKYNVAEAELKEAATQIAKAAAERDDAIAKFNELAKKYNAMIEKAGGTATKP
jgi:chromosome segregation ATPase